MLSISTLLENLIMIFSYTPNIVWRVALATMNHHYEWKRSKIANDMPAKSCPIQYCAHNYELLSRAHIERNRKEKSN